MGAFIYEEDEKPQKAPTSALKLRASRMAIEEGEGNPALTLFNSHELTLVIANVAEAMAILREGGGKLPEDVDAEIAAAELLFSPDKPETAKEVGERLKEVANIAIGASRGTALSAQGIADLAVSVDETHTRRAAHIISAQEKVSRNTLEVTTDFVGGELEKAITKLRGIDPQNEATVQAVERLEVANTHIHVLVEKRAFHQEMA